MEVLFAIVGLIVLLVLGSLGEEREQSGLRRMLIRRRIRAAKGLRRAAERRREMRARKAAKRSAKESAKRASGSAPAVAEVRPAREPVPRGDRLPIVETLPDPEPEAPVRRVDEAPAPEPPPEPEPEPTVSSPEPLALEELVRDLIASDLSGPARDRLFEERFAGREVAWSGELQRADTYRHDSTFGDGPGVRIVVLVHESPRGT
jgi:hypothetical protein